VCDCKSYINHMDTDCKPTELSLDTANAMLAAQGIKLPDAELDEEVWVSSGFVGDEGAEMPDYQGKIRILRWRRREHASALLAVSCVVELVGLHMTLQAVFLQLYRGQRPRISLPKRGLNTPVGAMQAHFTLFASKGARQGFSNELLRLVLLDDPQLAEELCEDINIPGITQ
jgi:hypothetical protein